MSSAAMNAGALQPVKPAAAFIPAHWIPLALAIALVVAQQVAIALRTLPPSAPITVALLVLTTLTATIPLVQQLLVQYQAGVAEQQRESQAHELRMEQLRAQARLAVTAGKAG